MSIKKYISVVAYCVGVVAVITGCIGCSGGGSGGDSDRRGVGGIPTTTTETTTEEQKRYNKEEVVVVAAVDTAAGQITVRRLDESAEFILSYNGGTVIKTKYDTQLMMEQVSVGEIATVRYISGTQKLIEMQEYETAWENTLVTRWDVDYDKKLITIGSDTYSYDDNIFITSNGKKPDIREISGIDQLTVRGIGNKAYSVSVNKGHGFVRLTDTVNYVGGVIEIGDRLTAVIAADMVIAAPEGQFQLTATINGVGGSKEINVIRGQETVVSLGSFEQSVTRYGTVKLNVEPEDAQATLTVDGAETDYSDLMSISYGKHTIKLMSNNYDTITKEITVSSVYQTININMDEDEISQESTSETKETGMEEPTEQVTDDTGETEETTQTGANQGSSNNLICITAPTGAKVYFDGAYVGTSPLTFEKTSGEHTIIFKKDGYVTKSYTIDVSEDTEDLVLSFPDMLEAQ